MLQVQTKSHTVMHLSLIVECAKCGMQFEQLKLHCWIGNCRSRWCPRLCFETSYLLAYDTLNTYISTRTTRTNLQQLAFRKSPAACQILDCLKLSCLKFRQDHRAVCRLTLLTSSFTQECGFCAIKTIRLSQAANYHMPPEEQHINFCYKGRIHSCEWNAVWIRTKPDSSVPQVINESSDIISLIVTCLRSHVFSTAGI